MGYLSLRSPPDTLADWEARLECRVEVEGWNGFVIPRAVCNLPMRRANIVLQSVLERHAMDVAARMPETAVVDDHVRRVIEAGLTAGEVTVGSVARALAMSTRTLQRRLARDGTSFRDLLDDVRRAAGARHLANPALSNAEVAYVLGFSELPAFHRACRRWFGRTPREFRMRGPG